MTCHSRIEQLEDTKAVLSLSLDKASRLPRTKLVTKAWQSTPVIKIE